MQRIGFPGLGIEFNINRVAFSIFGIEIYWYALIIVTGIILAYLYCTYECKRQGMNPEILTDVLLVGLPSSIVGARLYYVVFRWDYYKNNLIEIFNLRSGGIAIYGAIIFAVLSVYIYLRYKKINFFKIADIASIGLLIGQCIGRWGNFVNGEAYGRETTLLWRMDIYGEALSVHPTFFYESLWNLIGIIILSVLIRHKKKDGEIFLKYIMWYGTGRFLVEGLRTDSLMFYNLRVSQIVAVISVVVTFIIYISLMKKKEVD